MVDTVVARMTAGITVKDRRYHLKTYKQCFLGTEAVAFLLAEGVVGVSYSNQRSHREK